MEEQREEEIRSSESGQEEEEEEEEESKNEKQKHVVVVENENILLFLDSMDSYLTLMDSFSATVRQGWLELASARHSMGDSRINGALFDLKVHPASTTLHVTQREVGLTGNQPYLTLHKWASPENEKCNSTEAKVNEDELRKRSNVPDLRQRGTSQCSEPQEKSPTSDGSPLTTVNQFQKERSKSLSMFGTLVSPKLRTAQLSFETALETLVEVANMRSSIISAFAQIQKDLQLSSNDKSHCREGL